MATEHSAILNRLAAGEITADEAAELLRQPNRSTTGTPVSPAADAQYAGRRLRVRVTNLEAGRARADINVPLSKSLSSRHFLFLSVQPCQVMHDLTGLVESWSWAYGSDCIEHWRVSCYHC